MFTKALWHQGYATKAGAACRAYAFDALHMDEVYAIIRETNLAPQHVAMRNGMTAAAHLIRRCYGMDMRTWFSAP